VFEFTTGAEEVIGTDELSGMWKMQAFAYRVVFRERLEMVRLHDVGRPIAIVTRCAWEYGSAFSVSRRCTY